MVKEVAEVTGEVDFKVAKEVAGELFVRWLLYLLCLVEDDMMEVER